jgi:nucleotide-binding universal stress UspA family protein
MKILIATGGSDYSFMAVKKACDMVIKPETSEIRIISVYRDLAAESAEPLEISEEMVEGLENIEKMNSNEYVLRAIDTIKEHFPEQNLKISTQTVRGSAKKMILKEAEKWEADLIVVGSLGQNFLSRMFLGSVSEAVVRQAKCSVLVIRNDMGEK